ncbi:hypothetical protein M3Y97_00537800 [Aphelenchoides bicaudatus]|nr:hypothetical protein M3Y97_00537800 [Aphelenchoides bicaudatus]
MSDIRVDSFVETCSKLNDSFTLTYFGRKAKENLNNLFKSMQDADLKNIEAQKDRMKNTRTRKLFANAIFDFLALAILGVSMALVSVLMDYAIEKLSNLHISWLKYTRATTHGFGGILATYFVWAGFSVVLTTSCAIFVHYFSPQAIGSGIPEMKTVLRGVILKEYLSLRTMISKIVGLTVSIGSGIPIGKEGPFVHISSILANLLSKFLNTFDSVYINESRHSEMLAVGCAVGVACVFSAPVGGVLFSIEATSVYFAVRNYWRGFFSAACAATTFRLLRIVLNQELTVTAFFQTHFPKEAFFPEELPIFALIGLFCGLSSAAFIGLHRHLVIFLRSNTVMKKIFQKHWYIYPILVSFLISTLTYPRGVGQLLGGDKKFGQTAKDFFKNCTWSAPVNSSEYCYEPDFLTNWTGRSGQINIFITLSCFILIYFFLVILASTLPVPAGTFGTTFTLGAAFGRLVGELVYYIFPNGMRDDQTNVQVYPGIYSVVGAAAFCGGITHTISVAVIIFELTGQLVALLPVMISVLIANAVCSYFQPSLYDSIIRLKALPFLPDISPHTSNFYGIKVEQFMTSKIRYLTPQTTYKELQLLLADEARFKALPVVENDKTLILLGSSNRKRLLESLDKQVGCAARKNEALERMNYSFNIIGQRMRSESSRSVLLDNKSKIATRIR